MHIRKTLSGWMTLAVFAVGGVMVAADPAFAKTDMDQLTIGGEVRIRYEIRNNTNFNSVPANESAASHRVRVNVGYDLTPDVSFFAQLQDARIWGNDNTGTTTSGIGAVSSANQNTTGVDLHQGYILLKNVLVSGLSVKAGRMLPSNKETEADATALEQAVNDAIAACDGDLRGTVRALVVANTFLTEQNSALSTELDHAWRWISPGYTRSTNRRRMKSGEPE